MPEEKEIKEKGFLEELIKKAVKAPERKKLDLKEIMKEEIEKEKIKEKEIKEPEVEKIVKSKAKELIDYYKNVKIFKVAGQELPIYMIPVPKPTAGERKIINILKEAATRLVLVEPYRIRNLEQRKAIYYQKIMDILQSSPELKIPKKNYGFYSELVIKEMVGYGLIDDLVKDDLLEEIMVIGAKKPVYVFHRKHGMLLTNIEFYSEEEIENLINRIAREVGRHIDIATPLLDAHLADGSRVNATIKPVSVEGPTLTIRKFKEEPYSVIDLINFKSLDEFTAAFLWACVDGFGVFPANIVISGGTSSGKTTLLNVLSSFIPTRERIITIEDTVELNLPLNHLVRFEVRPPGIEGTAEITMDILTKNSLRMRPDRIIVGEVRHSEAYSLLTAMNTGHRGSLSTIHANSAEETIIRMTSPPMNVPAVMLSGLDLIIVVQKIYDRRLGFIRRITEIGEVTQALTGKPKANTIYSRDPLEDKLKETGIPSLYLNKLEKFTGFTKNKLFDDIERRKEFLIELKRNGIKKQEEIVKKIKLFNLKNYK